MQPSLFRSHLRLLCKYLRVNLTSALEYRTSFFMQAFGMALSNSSFIFFWWVAFDSLSNSIGGYTFTDMMFAWAVTSSAVGLSWIVFGNANSLSNLILTGELDTYLLQPKNVLLSMLCGRTILSAWGDFAYGIVLMALTQHSIAVWGMFALAVVIGALLATAIAVCAHSLTFFIGNATMAGSMAQEFLLNFCLYPAGIFPKAVQFLMYTVLPTACIVFLPLTLLRNFHWGTLLMMLGIAAVYCVLTCVLFYRGLRRYASGNLIVARQ